MNWGAAAVPSPWLIEVHHWPMSVRPATSIRPSPLKSPSSTASHSTAVLHTAKVDWVNSEPLLELSSQRPLEVKVIADSVAGAAVPPVTSALNVSSAKEVGSTTLVARTVIAAVPENPPGVSTRLVPSIEAATMLAALLCTV